MLQIWLKLCIHKIEFAINNGHVSVFVVVYTYINSSYYNCFVVIFRILEVVLRVVDNFYIHLDHVSNSLIHYHS